MTAPGTPVAVDNPNKNNTEHPAISGEYWHNAKGRNSGAPAPVDYDEEPFRVRSGNETGATKAKPRDDRETALIQAERTEEREILIREV